MSYTYKVSITTGDDGSGGTDANVGVKIIGTTGVIDWVKLNDLKSGNIFEKGDKDEFSISNEENISRIRGIVLYFDHKHPGANWRLYRIAVIAPDSDRGKGYDWATYPDYELTKKGIYTWLDGKSMIFDEGLEPNTSSGW